MNSKNAYLKSSASNPLMWGTFSGDIAEGRRAFLSSLETFPPQVRRHVDRYRSARVCRSDDRPLLGETLPWLLGEILDVTSHPRFPAIERAWFSIYYAVMITDDLLDRDDQHVSSSILSAHLLSLRGVTDLLTLSNNPEKMKNVCDRAFANCARAAFSECRSRENETLPTTREAIQIVKRKFAIAEICFAALSELNPQTQSIDRKKQFNRFLQHLMFGLQILDDLCDWTEDLACSHFTLPLLHGIQRSEYWRTQLKAQQSVNIDLAFLILIQTGAISESLSDARKAIETAVECIGTNTFATSSTLSDTFDKVVELIDDAHRTAKLLEAKLVLQYPLDVPLPPSSAEVLLKIAGRKEFIKLQRQLTRISAHS